MASKIQKTLRSIQHCINLRGFDLLSRLVTRPIHCSLPVSTSSIWDFFPPSRKEKSISSRLYQLLSPPDHLFRLAPFRARHKQLEDANNSLEFEWKLRNNFKCHSSELSQHTQCKVRSEKKLFERGRRSEKKNTKMEDQEQKLKINLNFTLLTGGNFSLSVDSDITVDGLKKIVSKKLKISKDRICLMNSERWIFFLLFPLIFSSLSLSSPTSICRHIILFFSSVNSAFLPSLI